MRDIDEEVVRDRRDPRREESVPPEARKKSSAPPSSHSGEAKLSEPPMITDLAPSVPPGASPAIFADATTEPPPSSRRDETRPRAAVTVSDPRLEEIEPFLRAGDWDSVLKVLGPPENAGRLPPNLGLIYALARKEKEPVGATTDARAAKGMDVTDLAIRCTAGLIGVPADSALALVVAKRLIRKNPVGWQQRPAPPASVSAIIIVIALVLGGTIGWLVATGHLRVQLRF